MSLLPSCSGLHISYTEPAAGPPSPILPSFTLSLEYLRGEFDQDFAGDVVSSDGSPADKRDLVTAQLAFEF